MNFVNDLKTHRRSPSSPSVIDGAVAAMVKPVTREETFPLRREVLRLTEEMLNFEEDYREGVVHLGAFVDDELVGIVTMFENDIGDIGAKDNPADLLPLPEGAKQWQFRGFATAARMQKMGVGKQLLTACVSYVRERGGHFLWCRARITAVQFYAKQGFSFTGDEFHVEGVGPHRYMFKYV